MGYVDEFAEKPDLETKGWLPRLELKDVVFFENVTFRHIFQVKVNLKTVSF